MNLGWAGPKWVISTFRRSKENINISHQFCTADIAEKRGWGLWGCCFGFGTSFCITSSMKNRWYLSLGIISAVKNNLEIFFVPSDRKQWGYRLPVVYWSGSLQSLQREEGNKLQLLLWAYCTLVFGRWFMPYYSLLVYWPPQWLTLANELVSVKLLSHLDNFIFTSTQCTIWLN